MGSSPTSFFFSQIQDPRLHFYYVVPGGNNKILPSNYLDTFYVDCLTHNVNALEYLVNTIGFNKIALGTDYPFPLGETKPGELISRLKITNKQKQRMYAGTALEWLGLDEKKYI